MRRRECGVATYVWGVLVVLVLALLVAVFFGAQRYLERVDREAYDRGRVETDAAYKARDNAALQGVITERDRLERALTQKEKDHANEIARLDAEHRRALARSVVWRDPGKTGACPAASSNPAADTGGGARPDGGVELSQDTREFLLAEAERADKVVAKLVLCRGVLEEERR